MMKMMVMMVMAVYIIGWHTFKIGVHVENASTHIERKCGFVEILSTLNVQWIWFFMCHWTETKATEQRKGQQQKKKTVYIVDLGKFMVTESDIGPLTYVRRYFCRKKCHVHPFIPESMSAKKERTKNEQHHQQQYQQITERINQFSTASILIYTMNSDDSHVMLM